MHVRLDDISATGGWFYLVSDREEGTGGGEWLVHLVLCLRIGEVSDI
jgi:hypothetical protein